MKITDKIEPAPQPMQQQQPRTAVAAPFSEKWEYYTIRLHTSDPRLRTGLNDLGASGWELVSLVPCLDAPGMVAGFLKRRLA